MKIFEIIFYISIIVWLCPLFRQYRTKYFYFFLVLGLTDVVVFILIKLFHINPQLIYPFSGVLLVCSLIELNKIKITLLFFITGLLIYLCWKFDLRLLVVLYSVFSFVSLLIILYHFLQFVVSKNAISIFFVFFIAYEFSLVLKNIVVFTNLIEGAILFYVTTLFEIAFGIIFTFVNVNTKVYKLPIKDIE
jgi:hypothetical protein